MYTCLINVKLTDIARRYRLYRDFDHLITQVVASCDGLGSVVMFLSETNHELTVGYSIKVMILSV